DSCQECESSDHQGECADDSDQGPPELTCFCPDRGGDARYLCFLRHGVASWFSWRWASVARMCSENARSESAPNVSNSPISWPRFIKMIRSAIRATSSR